MFQQSHINSKDGTKLFVQQWLIDDAKMTLLIVHGFAEHSSRYQHVAKFFNNVGINVVAFDLRGHGKSGGTKMDLERFSDYYDDVQCVIENLVSKSQAPFMLYGHSMGGLITAGYLAQTNRPQPKAAIISAPGLQANVPKLFVIIAKIFGSIVPSMRLQAPLKSDQLSRDIEVGKLYQADPLVDLNATVRMAKIIFAEQPVIVGSINQINIPCLVIHGGDDSIVPPQVSEILTTNKIIERRVFEGMRHECHNEIDKEQVLQHAADWLLANAVT